MSEEKPPFYRFVNASEEDRVASEEAEVPQYKDVVYVYIRTPGDAKTELKDYARNTKYEAFEVREEVEEDIEVFENGEMITKKVRVPKTVLRHKKKVVYPRLEKLRQWVKNGQKAPEILEDYEERWNRFLRKEDTPIHGTPLKDWMGAPEGVKRRAIEIGLQSVEEIADMDDAVVQEIGMGARDMQKRARAYLEQDMNPVKNAEKMRQMEETIARLESLVNRKEEEQNDSLDSMTDDELVLKARELGHETASKHWKRETLLTKIKEKEALAA